MCLINEEDASPKSASPRSPWAKLLNRQIKPRLPRKVTTSARVNLNKCWSKLGELISNSSTQTDLPTYTSECPDEEPILVPFSNFFYPLDPVKPQNKDDNVVNQNTANGQRFELCCEKSEIQDNVDNEDLSRRLVLASGDPRAGAFFAQRLSIAVQRGNGASVMGTMPHGPNLDDVFLL